MYSIMEKKVLIYRISRTTGRKYWKATKCGHFDWCRLPDVCWRFSLNGARRIVERLNKQDINNFFEYGYE